MKNSDAINFGIRMYEKSMKEKTKLQQKIETYKQQKERIELE